MRLPSMPAEEPTRWSHVEGDQGLTHSSPFSSGCASEKRGLIVVSGHIGTIDLLAGAFALRGLPTYGVADDFAYPELFEEVNAQRRRWGIEVIPWRNLRKVFSALREPAILGLVVDWGYRSDGIPVRLFGEWTALPAGPGDARGQDRRDHRARRLPAHARRRSTRRVTTTRSKLPIRPTPTCSGRPRRSPTRSRT